MKAGVKEKLYEQKKQKLVSDIHVIKGNKKISLKKETSNLFRKKSHGQKDTRLDVRSFNQVIRIDRDNLNAEVEGMTTYDDLVKETLCYSLLPTVVPELKSITIGGALSGCGIESSSFRYGLVHETVNEAEVLLGDGSVVSCGPKKNQDLFYALPNTFGTLGYALKVNVKLIPVKPYVKLTHLRFKDPIQFFKTLEALCGENRKQGVDFIDAVIFSKMEMVITLGEFTSDAPFLSDYKYLQIYYKSLQTKTTDYLTTSDYIWRWDADWFWCSSVFGLQNLVLRALVGKWALGSTFYAKLMHYSNKWPVLDKFYKGQESIIQDISIPAKNALDFFDFLMNNIGILPVWVCPTRAFSDENPFTFCPMDSSMLYFDFGFWGSKKSSQTQGYYNRLLEKRTNELSGFKSLYSTSYYSEDDFWEIYDKNSYSSLKQKYDPHHHLRGLYEKCSTK